MHMGVDAGAIGIDGSSSGSALVPCSSESRHQSSLPVSLTPLQLGRPLPPAGTSLLHVAGSPRIIPPAGVVVAAQAAPLSRGSDC